MEESRRCFCIGHRDTPDTIYPPLLQAIKRLAKDGVTEFIVGSHGNFDRLSAAAVRELKPRRPVTLTFLTPYHNTPIPDGFDGAWYPFETAVPPRVAIVRANRAAVDACDTVLTYARYTGNARGVVTYAEKKGKSILNLAT